MMSLRRAIYLSLILSGSCLQIAHASPTGPVIALHAKSHTTKGVTICSTWGPKEIDCTEFTSAARTGVPYDVYVVGLNPSSPPREGVAGIRWSIDYDGEPHQGLDVFTWTACGDWELPWPEWPQPKSGNTVVWTLDPDPALNTCQRDQPGSSGAQGLAGAFYVYAYSNDVFAVFPFYSRGTDGEGNPIQVPFLQLGDCTGREFNLDFDTDRGAIRFSAEGSQIGFNPCTGEGELPVIVPPPLPPPPPPPPPPPTDAQNATMLLHVALAGDHGGSCANAPVVLDSVKTSAPFGNPGTLYDVFLL